MGTTNSHVGNDSSHAAGNTKEYQGLDKGQGDHSVIPFIAPTVELFAPRLLSMIGTGAAGLVLSKSLEKLDESPEFDQMSDEQKLVAYITLYNIAKDQKTNKTETLPVDHAINSTGGSEIVVQGSTTTSLPMTEKEVSDYVLTTPTSDEMNSSTVSIGEDSSVLGLGAVYSDYTPAPKEVTGVLGLKQAKPKTPVQGGGGLRKRWKDQKGNIYEWDSQHGALEKYNKRGKHLGEFDSSTGEQTKPADKTRSVEP
jgi:hypothetical protein